MGSKPIGYSASRVAAICNLNKYQTPIEIWQLLMEERELGFNEQHGYILPPPPDSAAIRWGHAFEEAVIKLAEMREGKVIEGREQFFQIGIGHGASLSCHIDGEFREYDQTIHEGKTCNIYAYTQIQDDKQRWGEPGTDQVPEEYQVQAAVQRICTGADLVKLSVLVFPKPVEEFEKIGWQIQDDFSLFNPEFADKGITPHALPELWALPWAQQGNFHTYELPRNETLETEIIKVVQDFHENHILAGKPPDAREYEDVRRLLANPVGTIIATDELADKCRRYSEVTRQLGNSGPLAGEKADLKLEIAKSFQGDLDDPDFPHDKMIIVDPKGGDILATFSKSGMRGSRAKK